MSKFVNYGKRGVALPRGCSDLFDVLTDGEMPNSSFLTGDAEEGMGHDYIMTTLSGIGRYIGMALESQSLLFMLVLTSLDEQLTVGVVKMEDSMQASAIVQNRGAHEKTLRGFFSRNNLVANKDHGVTGQMQAELPDHDIYNISPVPSDTPILSKLVANLFRDVTGLKPDAKVRVRYSDFAEPA